jgi:U3 small nucleolar RNA-associated protein 14
VRDFAKEKLEEYENELPEEKVVLKGWGDWTGAGIEERWVDPRIEFEKKKKQIVREFNRRWTSSSEGRTGRSTM